MANKVFEIERKIIHLTSLFIPYLILSYKLTVQLTLMAFSLFYIFSEVLKLKGKKFWFQTPILFLQREDEKNRLALAPLLLAFGVLLSITFFSWEAALIGIYQAGFCDTMAALFGKKWGASSLPYVERKTYVGTLAFLVCALPVSFYLLPFSQALIISLLGAFLESLPFKDWDNLTVPLVITFLAEQFLFLA